MHTTAAPIRVVIARCTWPQTTSRTWGWRASTAAKSSGAASAMRSMWPIPVANGGWCMAIRVGRGGAVGRGGRGPLQPAEPLGAERAMAHARHQGVEQHRAAREVLDRVLQETARLR